jgi:glycosyltransferase involved in cell wall biosynthesis
MTGSGDDGVACAARRLRIGVVANTSWYLYNFRRNLIRTLAADGHRVRAVGGDGEYALRLRDSGIDHDAVPFSGAGKHPLREASTVLALRRVFARERFDVLLSYTPKGNIYSSLALIGLPTAQLMNVSGLGRSSSSGALIERFVRALYRSTMGRATWVFFQNEDDQRLFVERGLVRPQRCSRLPGSGVDLEAFAALPPRPQGDGRVVFLMVARLLWDKGVGEYAAAAGRLREQAPQARFQLLGALDPAGVPGAQLGQWVHSGTVEYLGETDDVRPFLRSADCVVLPSYREGLSRALLEAAASARPVVASDVPGCRDVVDPGSTGLLCRERDADDLARQLKAILDLAPADRQRMGLAGRAKVEREFDERLVIDAYRKRIESIAAALE